MSKLNTRNNAIVAGVLAIAVVIGAFWVLEIGPKREESSRLDGQVERLKGSLAQHNSEIASGEEARRDFAGQYQRLVVLGKAVPGNDETASLLVQVNHIADGASVRFDTLTLSSEGGESAEATPPVASAAGEPASPTEVAAATLPLGATIGPAGLGVMPYTLTFTGSFFRVADFINGLDTLVETENQKVAVDGRLLTINGFSMKAAKAGFPRLEATFSVTTYLTPPGEGLAGGATPGGPEEADGATPAATTTGGLAQ